MLHGVKMSTRPANLRNQLTKSMRVYGDRKGQTETEGAEVGHARFKICLRFPDWRPEMHSSNLLFYFRDK
jgi:hypothetical protein